MTMPIANKFDVIILDAYTSLFSAHQEHGRVECKFKLWTCTDE